MGAERLTAERIFINVGARAVVPAHAGGGADRYLTNSSMMGVDFLPRHLIIVGGSYIGLEFGQMFRRFGSEVTILEMGSRLVRMRTRTCRRPCWKSCSTKASRCGSMRNASVFQKQAEEIRARADCKEGRPDEVSGTHVLLAVGRRPNTDDLGLENAGVIDGRARVYRCRRSTAHQRPGDLGGGRLQRQGRVHAHVVERCGDRRREPSGERSAAGKRPHHRLMRCISIRRWGARA